MICILTSVKPSVPYLIPFTLKIRHLISLLLLSALLLIQNVGSVRVSPHFNTQQPASGEVEQLQSSNSTRTAQVSLPGPPCLPPETGISTVQFQTAGRNVSLPGHVVPSVVSRKASRNVDLPASSKLSLELIFSLRNSVAFKQCAESISDPESPNFRHFLNVTTLEPYAPTSGQKASMISFLQAAGFTVSEGPSPIVLDLTGNVRTVSRAFNIKIGIYRYGNSSFYSPDSDPSLPLNLASITSGIMGLDNSTKVTRQESPCTGPLCAQGVRVGYGLTNLPSGDNGNGVTVAITDAAGDPNPSLALTTFDAQYGLSAPSSLRVWCGSGTSWSKCTEPASNYDVGWGSEAAMDVEAVHTIAPGAGILVMYSFGSDAGPLFDAIDYVASQHLASIVSNSWDLSASEYSLGSAITTVIDSRLTIDAATGLTILFASGDQGTKADGQNIGIEFPASDPNVLTVGATNLVLNGCGLSTCTGYSSESGATISGGGYSLYFPEPEWQISNIGPTSGRAIPDVSMLGYEPGFWVYSTQSDKCQGDEVNRGPAWFGCAGTSLSTPLWAGFLAVALQMRGGEFGNVSPQLYQLGNSASYSSDFHDVTTGTNDRNGDGYVATVGWDLVTGWGSPIADHLVNDLAQKATFSTNPPSGGAIQVQSTSTPTIPVGGTLGTAPEGNNIVSGQFTPPTTLTVSELGVYVSSFTPGAEVRLGLYSDNGGGMSAVPTTLIAQTGPVAITASNTWLYGNLQGAAILQANTAYWVAIESNAVNKVLYYAYGVPGENACSVVYSSGMPTAYPSCSGGLTSAYFYASVVGGPVTFTNGQTYTPIPAANYSIAAIPDSSHIFSSWSASGSLSVASSTNNPTTLTVSTGTGSIVANFNFIVASTSTSTTSTSTSTTTIPSTGSYRTATTTSITMTSTSTALVCYSTTSTTQTTSVVSQATVTSGTSTSTSITVTTSRSTSLTTTSTTQTLATLTTTTTTTSACTASSTVSISTSIALTTTTLPGHLMIPIQLHTGWNLISLPVIPLSTSISDVLKSQIASQDISIVWTYTSTPRTWQSYVPGKGGTLTTMVDGNAYWIYMTRNDTLYVDGTIIPTNSVPSTYSLNQGWNLVGFKPEPTVQNETVGAYLSSIQGSYDVNNVWVYADGAWVRADSNYLLQPGQAMWILMTASATLRP